MNMNRARGGGAVNQRPCDPNSVPTIAERRRLLELTRAEKRFFRREMLRALNRWPGETWSVGALTNSSRRTPDGRLDMRQTRGRG
jgi:hypothetical protein